MKITYEDKVAVDPVSAYPRKNKITAEDLNEIKEVVNNFFPVGAIYISTTSTNPGEYFGGTWESFGAGKCLVGVDSSQTEFNTVLKTGGEKTHTLTQWEMPSHNHKLNNGTKTPNGDGVDFGSTSGIAHMTYEEGEYYWSDTTYTGGSGEHNNLQPYITVYMWHRIS